MPEGPELRHSRDIIRKIVSNRKITSIAFGPTSRYSSDAPDGYADIKLPAEIVSIDTKGKFMWWSLRQMDGTTVYMWCTYGMSGQWSRKQSKHWCVEVTHSLDSGESEKIYFNDPRHFGTIKFVYDSRAHDKKLASLGPDVLETGLSADLFVEKVLSKHTRTIAEALMDQKTLAGVGNYMKSEALFRSGISPWRQVVDIKSDEYVTLHQSVLDVAAESYASQGASIRTYKTVEDASGTTQFDFQIYSQRTCPSGHDVRNEQTPEGRTSWWCPSCQH